MSRKRIALGVGANLIDRIAMALVQLLLVPVLASHWGLERFGGWAMLITVPALFALGDLGFASAATSRMTMEVARGERGAARVTMRSAAQVVALACAVILALVAAVAWLLPNGMLLEVPQTTTLEMRWAITLLALYACLVMGSALLQGLFRSNQRFALGGVLSTVTTLLENGLLVLVVVLGHGIAAGAAALVLGRLLGWLAMAGVAASLRTGMLPALSGGSAAVRRKLLGPALAAMAIPLASALLLQGTVMALGLMAGAALVPAFVAARTLSRIGLQGSQILTTALMPEFGAATAQGNRRAVGRMVALVLASGALIAIPFAALLALAGPWIVFVWSNQTIAASAGLMLTIAVSALCGGIWNPLSNLILAVNRQSEFALAFAVLAVLGVGLTLLLGKAMGSVAPALALALVDVAMLVVVARFARTNWAEPGAARLAWQDLTDEVRRLTGRI